MFSVPALSGQKGTVNEQTSDVEKFYNSLIHGKIDVKFLIYVGLYEIYNDISKLT